MKVRNNTLLLSYLLGILLFCSFALAIPPLPTEFYGNITTKGMPVAPGSDVTAVSLNHAYHCAFFTVVTPGAFGLLTCPSDDPETPQIDGLVPGEPVQFYYNGELTVLINGDNTSTAGAFKYVRLSHPPPVCGDRYCDPFFESHATCPYDCPLGNNSVGNGTGAGNGTGNATTNASGSGGGGAGAGGGAAGGGGGGGGGGGSGAAGGGGGGGGGGGSASLQASAIVSALSSILGANVPFACSENWACSAWTNCTLEGLQTRSCYDQNACGTVANKPPEVQECEYIPTCYDGIQNGGETGIDCGGNFCAPCPGCNNGVKDGNETGIDCGGDCRPCDSCFDGIQDYGETGIDCGGSCMACSAAPPVLEYPSLTCEKPLNPLYNDARWFLLIVLLLTFIRVWLYVKELRQIRNDQLLDDFKRAQAYYEKRRELVLFILVVIGVCLLSYTYYYEFLLCTIGYQFLWLYLLLLLLIPLIIYSVLRVLTYSDSRKLALLRSREETHEERLANLLAFENAQLVDIEKDLAVRIENIATNRGLMDEFIALPELKQIYQDLITLYYEYHKSKTPTGIEKDLCDKTYAIETNEQFKKLADEHPDIMVIYQRLRLLYKHYEQKQQLYDELAKLREERVKKGDSQALAPIEEKSVDDKFDLDPNAKKDDAKKDDGKK